MIRLNKNYRKKISQPPGTLTNLIDHTHPVEISVMNYNQDELHEFPSIDRNESLAFIRNQTTSWINVSGVHDPDIIAFFGKELGLHPLVLEDIMNPSGRPKVEDYGKYLFLNMGMISLDKEADRIDVEKISLILGENYVLSFQEKQGDIFDPLRDIIRQGIGRVRKSGADYLTSALIDMVVDNYFPLLEYIDIKADEFEDIINERKLNPMSGLYHIKKQIGVLHRSIWPLLDVISSLSRGDQKLILPPTRFFFNNIYNHTIQILDFIETFRENITSLMELTISFNGDKLNSIMKFLTLISTIFIPLTFIAGIYGMNFDYMPELSIRWGYYAVLAGMGIISIILFLVFKIRRWF